ncbi:MAG: protein kinase [Bdellovibrionales bacterium]|nr:protein kinase [Bdellovibrionales bacterium]
MSMELVGSSRLAERFKVVGSLGTGQHGHVFLAQDGENLERYVALKVFHNGVLNNSETRSLIRTGCMHLKKMRIPGYVKPLEFVHHQGKDALVMEYIEGNDLESILREQGPLPLQEALDILRLTASILTSLHSSGMVHPHLTLADILLTGTGEVLLLGIPVPNGQQLKAGFPVSAKIGVGQFVAPEVLHSGHATPASDIYTLGALGLELLEQPTEEENSTNQLLVAHLLEVFTQATLYSPGERFQTTGEFMSAINNASRESWGAQSGTLFVLILSLFSLCTLYGLQIIGELLG